MRHPVFLALVLCFCSISCQQEGFLGCNNVLAFELDGKVFNATLFNNNLYRFFDPYAGIEGLELEMLCEDDEGNTLELRITDYRNGAFGNCITTEPYYANIGLNFCTPGFFCNRFTAVYTTVQDGIFTSSGTTGQIVILNCDPTDGRISGSFFFEVESLDTGDQFELTSGSFNLCYRIL